MFLNLKQSVSLSLSLSRFPLSHGRVGDRYQRERFLKISLSLSQVGRPGLCRRPLKLNSRMLLLLRWKPIPSEKL